MSNAPEQKSSNISSILSPHAPVFQPQQQPPQQQQHTPGAAPGEPPSSSSPLSYHPGQQQQQHQQQQQEPMRPRSQSYHLSHTHAATATMQEQQQHQKQQQRAKIQGVITSRAAAPLRHRHSLAYTPVSPIGEHTAYVTTRTRGMVKWFDNEKGYGFLMPDDPQDRQDVFVHQTMIEADTRDGQESFRTLKEKETVEFDFYTDDHGRRRCTRVFLPGGQKFPFQERPESFEVLPRMRSGSFPGKGSRRQGRQRSMSASMPYDPYNSGHESYQAQRYTDRTHYEDSVQPGAHSYGVQPGYGAYQAHQPYSSEQMASKVVMHTPTPSRRKEQAAATMLQYSQDPHDLSQVIAQQNIAVAQLRAKDPYTFHNFLPDTHRSVPVDIMPRTATTAPQLPAAATSVHQSGLAPPPPMGYAPHHAPIPFPAAAGYQMPPSPHMYHKDMYMSPMYGFPPSLPGSAFSSRAPTPVHFAAPPMTNAAVAAQQMPPMVGGRPAAGTMMASGGLGAVESATAGVISANAYSNGSMSSYTMPPALNIALKMPPPGYMPVSPVGSLYGSPLQTPIVTPRTMHVGGGGQLPGQPMHAAVLQQQQQQQPPPALATPRPVMAAPTGLKAQQNAPQNVGPVETSPVVVQIETAAALAQPPTYSEGNGATAAAGAGGAPQSLVPTKHYTQPTENAAGGNGAGVSPSNSSPAAPQGGGGANDTFPNKESQVREERAVSNVSEGGAKYRIEVTEVKSGKGGKGGGKAPQNAQRNGRKQQPRAAATNAAVIQDQSSTS